MARAAAATAARPPRAQPRRPLRGAQAAPRRRARTARARASRAAAPAARRPSAAPAPQPRLSGGAAGAPRCRASGPRPRTPRSRAPPGARTGGVLDALLSGRGWIALVFVLLVGIVFFNVDLLQMNREIARDADRISALKRENARLRSTRPRLGSSERIQESAAQLGLVLPAAGEVRYLKARPSVDARRPRSGSPRRTSRTSLPSPWHRSRSLPSTDPAVTDPAAADPAATDPAAADPAATTTPADPAATTAPPTTTAPAG